jgi:hypothetical protein
MLINRFSKSVYQYSKADFLKVKRQKRILVGLSESRPKSACGWDGYKGEHTLGQGVQCRNYMVQDHALWSVGLIGGPVTGCDTSRACGAEMWDNSVRKVV